MKTAQALLIEPELAPNEMRDLGEMMRTLTPARMNVFVQSPTFAGTTTERERWYGTEYSVAPIAAALVARCDEIMAGVQPPNARLAPPELNPFVASDFSLLAPVEGPAQPELLCDDRFCQVWYKR